MLAPWEKKKKALFFSKLSTLPRAVHYPNFIAQGGAIKQC